MMSPMNRYSASSRSNDDFGAATLVEAGNDDTQFAAVQRGRFVSKARAALRRARAVETALSRVELHAIAPHDTGGFSPMTMTTPF
jgi:hypothetical protein